MAPRARMAEARILVVKVCELVESVSLMSESEIQRCSV